MRIEEVKKQHGKRQLKKQWQILVNNNENLGKRTLFMTASCTSTVRLMCRLLYTHSSLHAFELILGHSQGRCRKLFTKRKSAEKDCSEFS
jgi:hypothetical protein